MRIKWLAAMLAGALAFVTAVGCGHVHTFSEEWKHDPEYHWRYASCEHKTEVEGIEEHSFENGCCATCGYLIKDGIDISTFVSEKVTKEEWESALSAEAIGNCKISVSMIMVSMGWEEKEYTMEFTLNGGNVRYTLKQTDGDYTVDDYVETIDEERFLFHDGGVDMYRAHPYGPEERWGWELTSYPTATEFFAAAPFNLILFYNVNLLSEIGEHFEQAKFDETYGGYVISFMDVNAWLGPDKPAKWLQLDFENVLYFLKFQNGKLRGLGSGLKDDPDSDELPGMFVVYGYGEAEEIVPPAKIDG